ncbi:LysR family transcriptional regulator [Komagataeibacter rhaeticus]|uniref:LysR family transcriptional regulator n=1 Tax=Komagataeibacter rhaeticus TaxID=215221 RepID=A0A181CAW5_9PROT|nr:LysR family transcriptional regulator [Komagataeibacter rhaeticus]ATU72771.1 LysR family transcriptional regulator [Komagataeibacter xylinus]EGG76524.1 putative RuBisCO transcriptional regulator [Gluconacetobacter sp. SXCC-1]MBL7239237.1 LysR family transcriptional regulator [Komagataeibacter rhaeticus]PYD52496.1 LysR family transcriptional regulator [Komagataeibacter rhaeticus]QIP35422.1 LysR family transcriptional regulator [Komagataeibacter rhaeticus]
MLHARLLRYLDAIVQHGSMRRAGEKLHTSSTAINRQVLALEAELGTPIFHRTPRRLVLTPAGEVLMRHVRRTLKDMEQTQRLIDDIKGLRRGDVMIGIMNGPATTILPAVISDLRENRSDIRLHVRIISQNDIIRDVLAGEIDVGIGFDFPPSPGIDVFHAWECPLGAVVAPQHELARRKSVTFMDCIQYPMIIGDCAMSIRPHLDLLAARIGTKLDPVIETNSVETMRRIVSTGHAMTFLTALDIAAEVRSGDLIYVPLRNIDIRRQSLSIITPHAGRNTLARILLDRFRHVIETVPGAG